MQPHCAGGDRQTESAAAGLAVAVVFDAIEGVEDFFQRLFGKDREIGERPFG
jgi:hypothetical protein